MAPRIISGVAPRTNCDPVRRKPFRFLPYFLIRTLAKALKVVAIRTKPSPLNLKWKPPPPLRLIIKIPMDPTIKAASFLLVNFS